jgi:hypothetical protein
LRKEGRVTAEPIRSETLWITSDVIRKITEALLKDALVHGTQSWDVSISKALVLCLQAALCCRIGDITRANYYTGMECLRYEHITIQLEEHEGRRLFVSKFVLQYCKDEK